MTTLTNTRDLGAVNRFLVLHSRLLTVLVLAVAGFLGGKLYLSHSADILIAQNKADQAQLKADAENSKQLAKQAQSEADRYATLVVELERQNAGLQQAIAARHEVVKIQQEKDKTLVPNEVARHWVELEHLAPGEVLPTKDGEFAVTDHAARATLMDLDLRASDAQDLKDMGALISNKDTELAELRNVAAIGRQQVAGLNVQLTNEQKACNDAVAAQKAKDKKSKRRWFIKGAMTGAVIAWRLVRLF